MQKCLFRFTFKIFKYQNVQIENQLAIVACNRKNFVTNVVNEHQRTAAILTTIQKILLCDAAFAKKIYEELPSFRNPAHLPKIGYNVKTLLSHGVTLDAIIDNAQVLIMPTGGYLSLHV